MKEYKDLADSLNNEKELIPRARRIFNNLSAIESILNRGITVKSLATVLSNNNFEITFEQLKNGIYQARKKKKQDVGIVATPLNNAVNPQKTVINHVEPEPPKEENQAVKRKATPAEEAAEELRKLKEFKQSKK